MLTLILGRAKSGKTAAIMEDIHGLVQRREGPVVLLVPEQYSHEAETELLRSCGDAMSLYAEVLSFTRLAARVENELGRRPGQPLDKGGRLLCMALALDAVGSRLKLYSAARRQAELQQSLLSTLDELRSACVTPQQLLDCAQTQSGMLADKLTDLSLVYGAYQAVLGQSRLDPTERLDRLAEDIGRSSLARGHFYLDGFTDFTRQELAVVEALLAAGAQVTVCLTCQGLEESHEIFEASRRAALALERLAKNVGKPCRVLTREKRAEEGPMAFLERELFTFAAVRGESLGRVSLYRAGSIAAECEAAAAHCLELVRRDGCRWRDIAVAVRSYEDYRGILESTFARYGVPVYSAGKSGVAEKPLAALIASAFEIVSGGWDYDDVFAYLKTGLAGLSMEETDTLENYAFLWSIRGSAWTREADWQMHPEGYNAEYTDETWQQLRELNALRRRVTGPLKAFAAAGKAAATASGQAQALAELFDALCLPETLSRRAAELRELGLERQAAETHQLWEIVVSALEQCAGILGDMEMNQETFGKLFSLVLSQYDVGTIPLSLDKVSAGDMDRMRRRHIRHLLVLGCDGERVPLIQSGSGIFTDDDRESLLEAGIDIGDTAAGRLCHEFALLYNCLTLPSDSLYLSYCAAGDEAQAAPSFVMKRSGELFSLPIRPVALDDARSSALLPAFDLAARQAREGGSAAGQAAMDYFTARGEGARLEKILAAASLTRGQLSRSAVRALYGDKLRLSASRIDKFASCRFAYFLQYGLKAKPRQAAAFAPPERGTFMHYVLEQAAREIQELGGFAAVTDEQVKAICARCSQTYIHDKLNDFRDKTPRFLYLFRRLISNVQNVVLDMVHELARSDFQPLSFELNFGDAQLLPPLELGQGEDSLVLTGIADRVDGWYHEGKLYVRVVDYKTGRKEFSLSDVWYGMGLQMLLYLFSLQREGNLLYGSEIVPAGVLYVPARDLPQSVSADPDEEEIAAQRAKALRRKGLLLADESVLRAMEHGDDPRYIPVTFKNGAYSGPALASAQQLGQLSRHIDQTLCQLAGELHRGSIAADPYFRSQTDSACALCDYRGACHFDEESDRRRYLPHLRAAQVWDKLAKGGED